MACPAILLWDLETLSFFMVTEAISCPGNFTFECFPCIPWNAYNKRYFAILPATSTTVALAHWICVMVLEPFLCQFQLNFSSFSQIFQKLYLYGSVILVVCYNPYGVFGFDFAPGRFGSELATAMLLPCNFFPAWIRYLGS